MDGNLNVKSIFSKGIGELSSRSTQQHKTKRGDNYLQAAFSPSPFQQM